MNVNDAIYNCRVCNPSKETHYRCDCDMKKTPKKVPKEVRPMRPIPEENSLCGLLVVPVEDLPGDYIGRITAIEKILKEKK